MYCLCIFRVVLLIGGVAIVRQKKTFFGRTISVTHQVPLENKWSQQNILKLILTLQQLVLCFLICYLSSRI